MIFYVAKTRRGIILRESPGEKYTNIAEQLLRNIVTWSPCIRISCYDIYSYQVDGYLYLAIAKKNYPSPFVFSCLQEIHGTNGPSDLLGIMNKYNRPMIPVSDELRILIRDSSSPTNDSDGPKKCPKDLRRLFIHGLVYLVIYVLLYIIPIGLLGYSLIRILSN